MRKIIAFSGACNSGKTTTINELAKALSERGHKVTVLSELLREYTKLPIDELRKKPSEYLSLQETIIRAKIAQEKKAKASKNGIYLVDRAITDSIFYLTFYLDKSKLTKQELGRFYSLYAEVDKYAKYAYDKVYDKVIINQPFKFIAEADKYRPINTIQSSDLEYNFMCMLNESYSRYVNQITYYDRINNSISLKELISLCE